jgi:hypothetical protein
MEKTTSQPHLEKILEVPANTRRNITTIPKTFDRLIA